MSLETGGGISPVSGVCETSYLFPFYQISLLGCCTIPAYVQVEQTVNADLLFSLSALSQENPSYILFRVVTFVDRDLS